MNIAAGPTNLRTATQYAYWMAALRIGLPVLAVLSLDHLFHLFGS